MGCGPGCAGGRSAWCFSLVDTVSGVVWPPVVVAGAGAAAAWEALFTREKVARFTPWGLIGRFFAGSSPDLVRSYDRALA